MAEQNAKKDVSWPRELVLFFCFESKVTAIRVQKYFTSEWFWIKYESKSILISRNCVTIQKYIQIKIKFILIQFSAEVTKLLVVSIWKTVSWKTTFGFICNDIQNKKDTLDIIWYIKWTRLSDRQKSIKIRKCCFFSVSFISKNV